MNQKAYIDIPLATQLDLVAELGAGWYRCDVPAGNFEGDTARLDALVAEADRRNLHVLPVLLPSPDCRNPNATPEQIRSAAASFAKAIASRYKGRITHWELGNELDDYALIHKGEMTRGGKLWSWDGAPDGSSPDQYNEGRCERVKAEILGLQEGVKAADPDAVTIVNTAGWLHYGFVECLVGEKPAVPFDILSWHWYSEMGDMTAVQGRLNLVELLLRQGKPLWITEVNRRDGSNGGKETEQAGYLRGDLSRLAANPGIAGLFVYELLDEPYFGEKGESDYGLVVVARNPTGQWRVSRKKESFAAYQSTIAAYPQQP